MALEDGEIPHSPMARMKPPKVPLDPPEFPRTDDLRRVLAACRGTSFAARRDRALIRLLADTGMRRSELANLRVDDLEFYVDENGAWGLARVILKGGRKHAYSFSTLAVNDLRSYVRVRRKHPRAHDPALWLGRDGRGPMTDNGIAWTVRRRGEQAGIAGLRLHLFRHASAHNFMAKGESTANLARKMGWSSDQMARRYAASAEEERARDEHRRLSLGDELGP
jgi:integrase